MAPLPSTSDSTFSPFYSSLMSHEFEPLSHGFTSAMPPSKTNDLTSRRPPFNKWRLYNMIDLRPDSRSSAFLHWQLPPADLSTVDTTHRLVKRQGNVIGIIPTGYSGATANPNDGVQPGTVAGIVLGTVAGVLFIAYLIMITATRQPNNTTVVEEVDIDRESSSIRSRSRHHRRRSSRRDGETVRKVDEENIEKTYRSRSNSPSAAPQPPPQIVRETERVYVERERPRTPNSLEDEIVVYEEDESSAPSSLPRKSKTKRRDVERTTEYREEKEVRRKSGARYVDPNEFGGGPSRQDPFGRRSSSRRDY